MRTHRDAVLSGADILTTNTRFVVEQFKRFWDYDRAIVVGQPVQFDPDLDGFRTRQRRNVAVIVGRLADPLKNTDLALRALSLMKKPPDLAMVWVGKAKHRPRSWFRRFRIEHHIEIPAVDLGHLVKTSRMLLAPSLFEGLGLPPIEALAVGTPAIVSDIPVKREDLCRHTDAFSQAGRSQPISPKRSRRCSRNPNRAGSWSMLSRRGSPTTRSKA